MPYCLPYKSVEELPIKPTYTEKYRQIGLKIASYCKLRDLTQEELATQVGLTPVFIGRLKTLNIAKALSPDPLFDIAGGIGCSAI